MQTNDIIKQIDAYAKAAGLKTSTVCVYAFGDQRKYDRLKASAQSESDIAKAWETFLAKKPMPTQADS